MAPNVDTIVVNSPTDTMSSSIIGLPAGAGSTFLALFLRSYSRRKPDGTRETWGEAVERFIDGLFKLGQYNHADRDLILAYVMNMRALPSGRWMWVGGTRWVEQQENFIGAYNCSSLLMDDVSRFGLMMSMAMMGTGTGAVLEEKFISSLPSVVTKIDVEVVGEFGSRLFAAEKTEITESDEAVSIVVGDSRGGWVSAYQSFIEIAMSPFEGVRKVIIDLSHVRKKGSPLKGFGGVANPTELVTLFPKLAVIMNECCERDGRLRSVECCKLIDEAALVVVAGSIRRSAGMRQGSSDDKHFAEAKDNLWQQDDAGNWIIDPLRDCLRMANHTRVFHRIPAMNVVREAVRKQFYSGEGAIQFAPEAIARANCDILDSEERRKRFIGFYGDAETLGGDYMMSLGRIHSKAELKHRMSRYGMNPCLAAGTIVTTRDGLMPVEKLLDAPCEIWDGESWTSVQFSITGRNQDISEVTLSDGTVIRATPYHNFVLEDGTLIRMQYLEVGAKLKTSNSAIREVTVTKHDPLVDTVAEVYCCTVPTTGQFALGCGILVGNCGEIIGTDFLCNLSEIHLRQLNPKDLESQDLAFYVGGLITAALLRHEFDDERQQYSREQDPIVGVSFTGLFDFFAQAMGIHWLRWWESGRDAGFTLTAQELDATMSGVAPEAVRASVLSSPGMRSQTAVSFFRFVEEFYLRRWREQARTGVRIYCLEHDLKMPNRCTTVQPAGSKSLLTDSSPGWHPPKGAYYIRRITYSAKDPLALALMDLGYNVVPGQKDSDQDGILLTDPHDPRVTEWLVEFPVASGAGRVEGADDIDFNMFSALAQFDFYMTVQNCYTEHNTSATIEIREHEIEGLATAIHQSMGSGFLSVALLPRSDAPFPRMPFEVISRERFIEEQRQVALRAVISKEEFFDRLAKYDSPDTKLEGPAQCDSDFCLK